MSAKIIQYAPCAACGEPVLLTPQQRYWLRRQSPQRVNIFHDRQCMGRWQQGRRRGPGRRRRQPQEHGCLAEMWEQIAVAAAGLSGVRTFSAPAGYVVTEGQHTHPTGGGGR